MSVLTAEKMATIHQMQVPISKEPTWLWKTMIKWLDTAEDVLRNIDDIDQRLVENIKAIKSVSLADEIAWFK